MSLVGYLWITVVVFGVLAVGAASEVSELHQAQKAFGDHAGYLLFFLCMIASGLVLISRC